MYAIDRVREIAGDVRGTLKRYIHEYKDYSRTKKMLIGSIIARILLFIAGVIFLLNGFNTVFLVTAVLTFVVGIFALRLERSKTYEA